jgi:serine/threonine-protein kinase
VHRDIKPGNIVIDADGRARLLDFGLARLQSDSDLTQPGSMAGTVQYMSPEVVKGGQPTPASDLFSLGVTMYQALTGRLPFEAEYHAAVLYAIVNEDPVPIGTLQPDLPAPLQSVVMKLLAKAPGDRYDSAADLRRELERLKGTPASSSAQPPQPWARLATIAVAILGVVIIALLVRNALISPDRTADTAQTVVVLPFQNLGDVTDEYFADGMTDALTAHLARQGDLSVIARTSAMRYKGGDIPLDRIADELSAAYAVTGTINRESASDTGMIRVSIELIRLSDGVAMWSESFRRRAAELFSLQNEIGLSISQALGRTLGLAIPPETTGTLTENMDAYDFFLRGNAYFNRSWDREDIEIAAELYQRAVDADSTFALAWAMLSRGHESMYLEYFDRTEHRCQLARQAADRALALQPDLVEGHLASGYCYYHCEQDYELALAEFSAALRRQPSNADVYAATGAIQRWVGDNEAAVENFKAALKLDPRSHLKAFDIALTYGMQRKFTDAFEYLDRTIALAPDWALPYIYRAWLYVFRDGDVRQARRAVASAVGKADLSTSRYYWWLARIIEPDLDSVLRISRPGADTVAFYLHRAQYNRLLHRPGAEEAYADSARVLLTRQLQENPDDPRFHSRMGSAYTGLHRKREALEHQRRAAEQLGECGDPFDPIFYMVNFTESLVVFGEYDEAVDKLRYMSSVPGFVSAPYLRLDPLWQPLHGRPRFDSLLTAVAAIEARP